MPSRTAATTLRWMRSGSIGSWLRAAGCRRRRELRPLSAAALPHHVGTLRGRDGRCAHRLAKSHQAHSSEGSASAATIRAPRAISVNRAPTRLRSTGSSTSVPSTISPPPARRREHAPIADGRTDTGARPFGDPRPPGEGPIAAVSRQNQPFVGPPPTRRTMAAGSARHVSDCCASWASSAAAASRLPGRPVQHGVRLGDRVLERRGQEVGDDRPAGREARRRPGGRRIRRAAPAPAR